MAGRGTSTPDDISGNKLPASAGDRDHAPPTVIPHRGASHRTTTSISPPLVSGATSSATSIVPRPRNQFTNTPSRILQLKAPAATYDKTTNKSAGNKLPASAGDRDHAPTVIPHRLASHRISISTQCPPRVLAATSSAATSIVPTRSRNQVTNTSSRILRLKAPAATYDKAINKSIGLKTLLGARDGDRAMTGPLLDIPQPLVSSSRAPSSTRRRAALQAISSRKTCVSTRPNTNLTRFPSSSIPELHGSATTCDKTSNKYAADCAVNEAILKLVSNEIGLKWMNLGRGLKIQDAKLDSLFLQYNIYGLQEVAFQMLRVWKEAVAAKATISVLREQLEEVGRTDLGNEIMTISTTTKEEYSSQEEELLKRIVSSLHDRYRNYIMKGLPWLDNVIRLADYYINLSVQIGDSKTTQHIHEAFQSAFSANKRPLRVLVEGPPGYGKTTLAAKLCFDHITREDYMKNFDLVLHTSLRSFEGDLKEMLCRAADLADSPDQEMFLEIINNSSYRILLVLDGFDEVPQQHVKSILAILQGQRFRHVAIVVTSRPGHFTFERWERENDGCPKLREVTVDWNQIWHSRIEILGIDESMKGQFIVKHLEKFPEEITDEALLWLQEMEDGIIESEFLECPLFLLMIILLATDDETGDIHNLSNPTDLYKSVFNFIIRRYCSKQNELVNEKIDLFTVGDSPKPFYVDLFSQFGEFALWALTEKKLSYFQEEILGSDPQRDPRIVELGMLTQSVSRVGFREKVVYEPVHKSLLEFSAAYALWQQSSQSDHDSWAEKVVRLWRCEEYGTSLCLIMLEGLMGNRIAAFFDALSPYASCGVWEKWLRRSVSEIDLTEPVLSSLTPFLPAHWEQRSENCFSRTQHDALLVHGIREGRIKRVELTGFLATPMPDDVVVDTAEFLRIDDTMVNAQKFNCRRLVFEESNVFRGLETWIPSTINFQALSLEFRSDLSSDLHRLCSAITAGALKDIQMQVGCEISKTADVVALTELIEMEKLKSLSLYKSLFASEELNLNSLLRAAANSSQLTTLLLEDWRRVSIDLCHLCGGIQKTWQFLSITDCDIDFPPQTDKTFQANCLVLRCPDIPAALLRFLEVCQVTSLRCRPPLLADLETFTLLPEHLTELNVLLHKTIVDAQQCRLPYLPNLTVLILSMTRDGPRSLAVRDFLFGSRSVLQLKGIEIWGAGWNEKLSLEFMKCVSGCLEQSIPVPTTCEGMLRRSHSLQLEYFLLQSDYRYYDFLAPIGEMATHLRNKSLSRLDIVLWGSCSPNLLDLFSPAEGFRVETDLWGTRSEDTILCRMEYDTHRSWFNCYSIRHTDN